jgi:hypothetical protein
MQSSGSRTFLYSRPGALQWLLALLIASALAACDLGNDPVTARVTAPADVTSTVTGTVHTPPSASTRCWSTDRLGLPPGLYRSLLGPASWLQDRYAKTSLRRPRSS